MTPDRCPWFIAGPLLGLVIVGLRAAVNKPLGALGGYVDLAENAGTLGRIGFRGFVLLGIVLGGALFALTIGTAPPTVAYGNAWGFLPAAPLGQLGLLLGAGAVMGFGARTAGGCTSGHGMTGMALGSPASMVAFMTFFSTAVVLAHGLATLSGGAR